MKTIRILLQLATISVFIGRGYQHIMKGGPYRTFFLNDDVGQDFMVWYWNMDWISILKSLEVGESLRNMGENIGWLLFVLAFIALILPLVPRWIALICMSIGTFILAFIALCLCIAKAWSLGQLLEYSSQVAAPLLLYAVTFRTIKTNTFLNILKVAIALTFICHGLYALGYYPRPGTFVDMTIRGFGVTESTAHQVLYYAGLIDIIIAIGIFIPIRYIFYPSVLYAIIWGAMTTVARLYCNYYPALWLENLKQWTPEVVFRFPHWILPLVLFLMMWKAWELQRD